MQNPGHQSGTPGFVMIDAWKKSKIPWPAIIAATSHRFFLNPIAATSDTKTAKAISAQRARAGAPITANNT
jgi:hypothetical protein